MDRLLNALPRSGYVPRVASALPLPDMDDQPFLAAALGTTDKAIVTGNPLHFSASLMKKHGVTILSPRHALNRLAGMKS